MQMYLKFCQFFCGVFFLRGVLKVQVGLPREHVRELALHVPDILVYWLGFCPLYLYVSFHGSGSFCFPFRCICCLPLHLC